MLYQGSIQYPVGKLVTKTILRIDTIIQPRSQGFSFFVIGEKPWERG
jgi:hypothetical protein